MPGSDSLDRIDRQIAVTADLIDQYRRLIRRMKADGRNTDAAQWALDSLEEVYRQRLVERSDLDNADWSARKRRAL